MRGKLIVIEGTESSGKETQTKLLVEALKRKNIKIERQSFPCYDTSTGKIIGACYLGKEDMCNKYLNNSNGWFEEGATEVDGMVSSLFYAADRKYNLKKINDLLAKGINVVLERYTYSNMAHQGCKFNSQEERFNFFKKMEVLEFDLLELPKPDIVILLYVPYQITAKLLKLKDDFGDGVKKDINSLRKAEQTYLELRALYKFKMIECTSDNQMLSIDDIHQSVLNTVCNFLDIN